METVISVSGAGIGAFSGSDMSSIFDESANHRFVHPKYSGGNGDGEVVIFAFVTVING